MNRELSDFLRSLADKIDSETIQEHELLNVTDFFVRQQVITRDNPDEITDDDMMKFLFLGYYIYRHLIPSMRNKNNEKQEHVIPRDDVEEVKGQ